MPCNECFKLLNVEIFFSTQKCNYSKVVSNEYHMKITDDFKSQQTLTAWSFSLLLAILIKGGYFSSVDLKMDIRVHLREVSAYERCPLMGG